jgi:two-component system alkaline phosphatase synthesis response regulator PhoP
MAKRILIVDDDPDLVEAVTMILESKNYTVAAAYGGIEGLQKAKSEKPDLIVLDVMMPDKDGYAVCKELKSDPKVSKIPILLLTAVVSKISTTRYTQQMGLETEADDYIDKPVEPEVLVKRIEALLTKERREIRSVAFRNYRNGFCSPPVNGGATMGFKCQTRQTFLSLMMSKS